MSSDAKARRVLALVLAVTGLGMDTKDRIEACRALAAYGDFPAAIRALQGVWEDDPEEAVRCAAGAALQKARGGRATIAGGVLK